MITKGTKEYKRAQEIAEWLDLNLNGYQRTTREVAKTVAVSRKTDSTCIEGGYRMSSKQAWIIACAMVENSLNF